jgi:hypothetical protein
MENTIDVIKTEELISKIKYPIIFLFSLTTYINILTDIELSIIFRLFLKYHSEVCLSCNVKEIFKNELINYNLSWCVLDNFYKLMKKKIMLIFSLKKWSKVYINKKFWNMITIEQIDYIINLKLQFNSIYDCSRTNTPFHMKLGPYIQDNKFNDDTSITIKERLIQILKLFGKTLFKTFNIPIITIDEYNELTPKDIIKYLLVIYEKFNIFLDESIKMFSSYNMICEQIKTLISPVLINIETRQIDTLLDNDELIIYSDINN